MKVHVDPVKCDGFGLCNKILPEVFPLDEWGYAYTKDDNEVSSGQEDKTREAVHKCPVAAIVIRD